MQFSLYSDRQKKNHSDWSDPILPRKANVRFFRSEQYKYGNTKSWTLWLIHFIQSDLLLMFHVKIFRQTNLFVLHLFKCDLDLRITTIQFFR